MKFTAEDFIFNNIKGDGVQMVAEASADRANARLEAWLAEAPKVYAEPNPYAGIESWQVEPSVGDTHTARLVCIEEIKT